MTAEEADVIGNGLTQDGDAAQQTEWGTVRNTFAVEKKATGMALQNGLALRGDGTDCLLYTSNTFIENMDVLYLTIKVDGEPLIENAQFVVAGK